MKNNGEINETLSAGEEKQIPAGYTSGGVIKAGTEEVGAIVVPADSIINEENVSEIIEKEIKTLSETNLASEKSKRLSMKKWITKDDEERL